MAASNSKQLGEFLRRRRERLDPRDLGLSAGVRRRTPGLRREEVAERSGISVDWYVRLEQGRDSLPSRATVEALSKALKLSSTDRAHLIRLASPALSRIFVKETPPPNLVTLVKGLNTPAYVIGARLDLLCWNRKAVELFRDYSKIPTPKRNSLYQMFTAPEMKARYPEWSKASARHSTSGQRLQNSSASLRSLKRSVRSFAGGGGSTESGFSRPGKNSCAIRSSV
jgi:transcriptional regulator with XRE-family HTH domain